MKLLGIILLIPLLASWGFGVTYRGNNPDIGKYEEILNKHNAYYRGNDNEVYLTFDTGYETGNTDKILDVLKEKNVKATFFVTGHFMKTHPELIKRMFDEGHIVGNHTWGHPNITKISNEKINNEINKLNDEYKKITGEDMPKYFRPPCGEFSDESLSYLDSLGYKTIFWSLAYKDWEADNVRGKEYAVKSVMSKVHSGAIILLHTVSKDNLDGLGEIIDGIRSNGYDIKNIDSIKES